MSDATAQEPTMEEILASIRRIISEDDAPAAAADEPAEETIVAAMPPGPAVVEEPEVDDEDDVLELTESVSPPQPEAPLGGHVPPPEFAAAASQVMGDLDISFPPGPSAAPPKAAPPPIYSPPAAQAVAASSFAAVGADEGLLSTPTLDKAASMFGALGRNVIMPAEGRTLEDLVSELLRPMLRDWLDQHLPSIVEAKVQAEVERVSRHR